MTSLQAALLGVVQGLTEFLPISSSAHLLLVRAVFGWEPEPEVALAFDVACHVGTLFSVLFYFRREISGLLHVAFTPSCWFDDQDVSAAMLRSIVIGTIPIVLVGLVATDVIFGSVRTVPVTGIALAVGGIAMFVAERYGRGDRVETSLSGWEAVGLGFAQALALAPGVSRSGAVLTLAMLFGLRRERAARFSFLLGIPAIIASAAKTTLDSLNAGISSDTGMLFAVGIVSSSVVGYLTVKYFIRYVSRYSLNIFVVYRLLVATAILFWVSA